MRECGNGGWSTSSGRLQAACSLSSCSPPVGMGSAPGAPWPWPVATLLDNGDGRYHHSLNQHHHVYHLLKEGVRKKAELDSGSGQHSKSVIVW